MKLIFKNDGPTIGLLNWLESFKDLQKSLLVEIDLTSEYFISKAFPGDHSFIKYSKISFKDAGVEVSTLQDNNEVSYSLEEWNTGEYGGKRIKMGIFMVLSKFIQVVKTFSTTDYKITIFFDITSNKELHAQALEFVSKTLTMKVANCNVSEFEEISDDIFFNNINKIENPMIFKVSKETIKNLDSISSVFSLDSKKDIIKFYTKKDPETKKWAMYALDYTNSTYDYMLAFIDEGVGVKSEIKIYRNNFFMVSKDQGEYVILTFSNDTLNKMRLESEDKNSTTIIASVSM